MTTEKPRVIEASCIGVFTVGSAVVREHYRFELSVSPYPHEGFPSNKRLLLVEHSDYEKLEQENARLRELLDECQRELRDWVNTHFGDAEAELDKDSTHALLTKLRELDSKGEGE